MNQVTYTGSTRVYKGRPIELLGIAVVALAVCAFAGHTIGLGGLIGLAAAGGALVFGANTVTYEWPITGLVAPTADQSRTHQAVSAIITGDGAATTFTVTHNWGLSTAEIAAGFPWVNLEPLLVAYYTANPFVSSKAGGQAVVFTNVAFATAAIRVTLWRPWSAIR